MEANSRWHDNRRPSRGSTENATRNSAKDKPAIGTSVRSCSIRHTVSERPQAKGGFWQVTRGGFGRAAEAAPDENHEQNPPGRAPRRGATATDDTHQHLGAKHLAHGLESTLDGQQGQARARPPGNHPQSRLPPIDAAGGTARPTPQSPGRTTVADEDDNRGKQPGKTGGVPYPKASQRRGINHRLQPEHISDMLTDLLIFAFAVGLVVAYVVIAIKTVNESES